MTTAASEHHERYTGFISYSHSDKRVANRLHRALEAFRLPKGLRSGSRADGRLGRFYLDDDEMAVTADIAGEVRRGLETSDFFIVVCSPRSAESRWVNAELDHFRALHGGERIFAVVASGTPNSRDPQSECFPRTLRNATSGSADMPVEPFGIDLEGDRFSKGLTRLVAGIAGVNFDALWQREVRRRRARRIATVVAAISGLALTGIATYGIIDAEISRRQREETARAADVAAIKDIEVRSRLLANRANDISDPVTSMLVALEAWNTFDPRTDKSYRAYVELPVKSRIAALKAAWIEEGRHDPDHALASAVVRKALSNERETFYRRTDIRYPSLTFSPDRTLLGVDSGDERFSVEKVADPDSRISGSVAGYVVEIGFSKNGTQAFVIGSQEAISIDMATKAITKVGDFSSDHVLRATFNPSRTYVALAFTSGELSVHGVDGGFRKRLTAFDRPIFLTWPNQYIFVGSGKVGYIIDPYPSKVTGKTVDLPAAAERIQTFEMGNSFGILYVVENGELYFPVFGEDTLRVQPKAPITGRSRIEVDAAGGKLFAMAAGPEPGTVNVLDLRSGSVRKALDCNNDRVSDFALSGDATRVAVATRRGNVCVLDAATFAILWSARVHDDEISAISFDGSDTIVFATSDGGISAWRYDRKPAVQELKSCEGELTSVLFDTDGDNLIGREGSMGLCIWSRTGDDARIHAPSFAMGMAIAPLVRNRDEVVLTDRWGQVIEARLPHFDNAHLYRANGIVFREAGYVGDNGTKILGQSIDGELFLWDRGRYDVPLRLDYSGAKHAGATPGGDVIEYLPVTFADGSARIFNVKTGATVSTWVFPEPISLMRIRNDRPVVEFRTGTDGLAITLEAVKNAPKEVRSIAEFKGVGPAESVSAPGTVSFADSSRAYLLDLLTGTTLYSFDAGTLGYGALYGAAVSSTEGGKRTVFATIVKDSAESSGAPKVALVEVPPHLTGVLAPAARRELEDPSLPLEARRILVAFWSSEQQDSVFRAASEHAKRCLTPEQRAQYRLEPDPPCWCAEKAYPSAEKWRLALGRDPFTAPRRSGRVCTDAERRPWSASQASVQ
jgi:hypothetical protein